MDGPRSLPGTRDLLKWITVVMLPFISWERAPWVTGVFGLLVALGFLLRIRESGPGEGVRVRFTPFWAPFALLMVLSVAHLAFSPVPYSSLLFIVHLCLAWVLYLLILDEPPVGAYVPVLIWTGTLIAWMTVQKFFPGLSPPTGPFSNPNYLATVLLTCLAWSLGSIISGDRSHNRVNRRPVLFLGSALALTAALVVIGSRSAGLAIIALWGVFLLFNKGRLRFIAVVVVVLILLVPTTFRHRVTEEYLQDPHAFSRLQIWEGALRMGLDHPLVGVGPNLYYERAPRYAFPTETLPVRYGRIARKPHNEYLRAWAEGGAVGIAVVLGFLFVTLRFFISAWKRGHMGPALAVAVFLFQALFHDVNEVLALTALGAFWLAQLSSQEARTLEIRDTRGKGMLILAAVMTLLMALWLNLDVSARVLWMNGRRLVAVGSGEGVEVLSRAHGLNPLLPGAARDLAGARLAAYKAGGTPEEREVAEAAIRGAHRLNRLDTAPLRMEAELFVERSGMEPGRSRMYLMTAREKLMEALELEPYNALIMFRLSEIQWYLGEGDKALQTVERSLVMEPNFLEAHRTRIRYLSEHDPVLLDEARLELKKAEERAGEYRPWTGYERIILR